ncbi:MAG TPA: hypothetical protein DGG95_10405 [Cytophagales bacterium]|jgi:hypothetical protein|nr:hypothetical protein [Cytophagales bacterium]
MIFNPLRLIEIFIVKMKIKRFVHRGNSISLKIKINNQLPNREIVRISKINKDFYQVELDEFQLTYTSKGNARAALNSIFHYLLTNKFDTTQVYADLSDGGNNVPAELNTKNLSFSSNTSRSTLIPDHHFTSSEGYMSIRKLVKANTVPWHERKDGFLWRGSTTGDGFAYTEPFEFGNEKLLPRVRMCLKLADYPEADVAIAINYVLEKNYSGFENLIEKKIAKESISQNAWLSQKFAIDIDGHTNAWQNFFSRMLMGCCVIKIDSFQNFRQWYYDQLVPWKHFVPVKSDMSDLIEKLEWCKLHDKECEQIAKQAQQISHQIAEKEFPFRD